MSKKRRTKEEKIKAQNRRITSLENPLASSPVYSISHTSNATGKPAASLHMPIHSYTYVMHDIRQTLIIVSILLGINVLLFTLTQNHILKILSFGN